MDVVNIFDGPICKLISDPGLAKGRLKDEEGTKEMIGYMAEKLGDESLAEGANKVYDRLRTMSGDS